jgi:hypothetical protein
VDVQRQGPDALSELPASPGPKSEGEEFVPLHGFERGSGLGLSTTAASVAAEHAALPTPRRLGVAGGESFNRAAIVGARDETAVAVDLVRFGRASATVDCILRCISDEAGELGEATDVRTTQSGSAHPAKDFLGFHTVATTSAQDKTPPKSFRVALHHFIVVFFAALMCWATSITIFDQFADRNASDLPMLSWHLSASGTGPGPDNSTATDAVTRMAKTKFTMITLEAIVTTGIIAVALEMILQTVHRTFPSTRAVARSRAAVLSSGRGAAVFLLALAIVLQRLRHAVPSVLNPHIIAETDMVLLDMVVFSMFGAFQACLVSIQTSVEAFADNADRAVKSSPPVTKWREVSRNFCKFEDPAKRDAYSFHVGVAITPARVLAEICALYVLLAKGIALVVLIFHFVGADLYENIIILSASVVGTTVIAAVALNDATRNLVALTLSNLFYLGEIISVSPASATANMPEINVTGFVEAITWTHIVVRDFYRKQVFISHQSFQTLMVTNWTRRPEKICRYMLSLSAAGGTGQVAAKVSQMSNVVRKIIDEHPDIDQSCYKKAAIKASVATGITLEVVFYPLQKAESRQRLRAEFIMILMEVADRLGLKVVPHNIATPFPEDLTGQQRGAAAGGSAAADPTANFDEMVQDAAAMSAFEDVMPANFERLYWYDQKKRPAPPPAPKTQVSSTDI